MIPTTNIKLTAEGKQLLKLILFTLSPKGLIGKQRKITLLEGWELKQLPCATSIPELPTKIMENIQDLELEEKGDMQ